MMLSLSSLMIKKSSDLSLKVTPVNEQVKVLTIETPDGKKTEGPEASYKAEKKRYC